MPVITFVKNVTLDGVAGGPHYSQGYCVEASDGFAAEQIKAGNAVLGAIKMGPDATVAVVDLSEVPSGEPLPKMKKGGSKWR